MKKPTNLISVVTPCFNEEENIQDIYEKVKNVFSKNLSGYRYEHIFIDNASTDNTVNILRSIAQTDKNIKIIINARNFGWIRSPYYGILQAYGDAVISIVADLQDPPELIPQFIKQWESGFKIVVGVKPKSKESAFLFFIRRTYYKFISKIANVKLIQNFTGFGLYDQTIINILRNNIDDTYPYFRGLISEIGFDVAEVPYVQPIRKKGKGTVNFYKLYDAAMLGITSHSKVPIRLAIMAGFGLGIISFLLAIIFLMLKLIFWSHFNLGIAPILIGLFFFSSIQLFFIGLLGEYIAAIHTQVLKRPLVIEKERVNFNEPTLETHAKNVSYESF